MASEQGAKTVGITDASSSFVSNNVEGALQEIGSKSRRIITSLSEGETLIIPNLNTTSSVNDINTYIVRFLATASGYTFRRILMLASNHAAAYSQLITVGSEYLNAGESNFLFELSREGAQTRLLIKNNTSRNDLYLVVDYVRIN